MTQTARPGGLLAAIAIGAALLVPQGSFGENLNERFGPTWTCTKLGAVEYSLYRACKMCEENCQDFFRDSDKAGHCLRKSVTAAACPAAAAAPPPQPTPVVAPASGESAGPGAGYFEFKVCNRSGRMASVAVEHYVSPADTNFLVQGWWTVPAGECQVIGSFPKGWFYYYAAEHGTDAFEWAGRDAKVCIDRIGPVERMHTRTMICTGKYLRRFHAARIEYPSVTWNLDP